MTRTWQERKPDVRSGPHTNVRAEPLRSSTSGAGLFLPGQGRTRRGFKVGVAGATAHLAARGRDVVGVDIAAEMLAIAEARVPTGRFVVGDLCALPLATASVTGAVSGLALAHASNLEAAAALRPGFAEAMQIALVGLPAVLELERCPKAVV